MGRFKSSKKSIQLYKSAFQFRPPFQIIVDAVGLADGFLMQLPLQTAAETLLGGPVKLMTTQCALDELEKLLAGQSHRASARANEARTWARELELRRCAVPGRPSKAQPHKSAVCLAGILGTDNAHHYCVLAQVERTQRRLRSAAGVPLLRLNRGVLVLEAPSPASAAHAAALERSKLRPQEFEVSVRGGSSGADAASGGAAVRRRPRAKAPNPLSCKKRQPRPRRPAAQAGDSGAGGSPGRAGRD